jgi:hypothetical protein
MQQIDWPWLVGRKPESAVDANAIARVTADVQFRENVAVELGQEANHRAANAEEISAKHRDDLATFFRPEYNTTICQLAVGDTAKQWMIPSGVGWMITGLTIFPAVANDQTTPANQAVLINGLDEIQNLFVPIGAAPSHVQTQFRAYGLQAVNLTLLGGAGGKTLVSPVVVVFEMQRWANQIHPSGT